MSSTHPRVSVAAFSGAGPRAARSTKHKDRGRAIRSGLLTIATMAGLAACGGVDDDTPQGVLELPVIEWQVVFEDDFDGNTLDATKWTIDTGDGCPDLCGWGNNEAQTYSADNITVADGILTIQGREEQDGSYTSGRINSKGKFDFRYGRVEVSARLPAGQGTWPAIWLLHSDPTVYGPWPVSGEIDIMEAFNVGVNGNTATQSAAHYGLPTPPFDGTSSKYDTGVSPDMAFHEYALEWERDKLRFYVDGVHFQTQNAQNWYAYYPADEDGFYDEFGAYDIGPRDSPFDQLFHLILNFAIGGDPVGDPDPNAFPQNFEIDYVRVYECVNANPDTGRGCGTADPAVVPLDDNDGGPLQDVETAQPYLESMSLFVDGPEVLSLTVGDETSTNTLGVNGFTGDGATVINDPAFADPDEEGNIVWRVAVSGGVGNVYLESQDLADDPLLDTGFDYSGNRLAGPGGDPVGELAFDMKVNSITPGTDLLIKLDSGFPNLGQVVLPESEILVGDWKTYSVKFDALLANPFDGGTGVDLENVLNPFVFEVQNGDADVYLDNIRATNACKVVGACGVDLKTKGIPDVVVFDDAVNLDVWNNGIRASDSGTDFADYTDPSNPANKVNWAIVASDEPERGQVIEVTFNDSAEFGVWFIQSSGGVDLSAYNAGAVQFDLKVLNYGNNVEGMTFKIDCFFPCGSGDEPLGFIADGVWETVTYPVSRLLDTPAPPATGLDLTAVNTGIVLFPTTQSGDIVFQVDDVRWIAEADQGPLQQIDLPVTFDDPTVDYALGDFGDATTVLGEDPEDAENTVAITTKNPGAETFAGTTIGTSGFATPIPFTADETSMSADVRVPLAGIAVKLKVETADCPTDNSDPTCFAEADAFPTVADQWETLTWDFAGIDPATTFVKATIFFDFGVPGDGATYYWDNVRFGAPPAPPPEVISLENGDFETGDFTGWVGNGNNVVGAPVAGAQSGASAALLTTTGGSGVADISQTFAANPGDEVNLSVWMLTEAALPEGASFGLAKIVFKDAGGNDLPPESASIGTINVDFPGIESQPLNSAGPVDTWVFSEAQGVAPAGTATVQFLLLNVDFAGGENPIWFDNAQATRVLLDNGGFETGDFTGWVGNGNNVVGAPIAGAQSGASAALLTTTGGNGVADISQSFAAGPGDEVNLSVWMLTEAALPAGASFGLAKIVFKDAGGNDLPPESASIGTINVDFPGIESQPINSGSPVDTWVFSEAQGVAPAGTATVQFLLLNVDFAGGENPIWFDNAQAIFVGAGP